MSMMTIMLDLSKVILLKMISLKTLMMIKSILMKMHWGHQSLAVHLKPRNKESKVLIVVVTMTMMKKK